MTSREKAHSLAERLWFVVAVAVAVVAACEGGRIQDPADANPSPPVAAAPPAAPHDAADTGTLDGVLRALTAGKEDEALRSRLQAMFEHDDAGIAPALDLARAGTASKLVVEAFAAAGTSAGQAALCTLAADSSAPIRVRTETISALALIKHPTQATLTAVADLVASCEGELRHAMLFAAGSVARAGRENFPASTVAIEKALLAGTARAMGEDRVDGLAALGNLGTPAILPRIRAALASADPRVRAAGARALRLVPDPGADRLLVATLRRDREPTVRAAAIFAAGFRNVGPLTKVLSDTAESDPVEYVRAGAVTLLARGPGR